MSKYFPIRQTFFFEEALCAKPIMLVTIFKVTSQAKVNGIRNAYMQVSGLCSANIYACTTPSGHASDCAVSKQL